MSTTTPAPIHRTRVHNVGDWQLPRWAVDCSACGPLTEPCPTRAIARDVAAEHKAEQNATSASNTVTIPESDSVTPEPTPTPTRKLVLIGKVGPRFGFTEATVQTNGRRTNVSGNAAALSIALNNAAADYAKAVAS